MSHHFHQPPSARYSARAEKCPDLPVCPACGELECLCRPRFFAGQCLTEEDLNLLEHYVVKKNQLHNRYLHGWGVVCGLEVLCHPCQRYVMVKSGYALSPCGDDIVLCRDEVVDICDLINKCRDDQRRRWDCDPASPRPQPICGDQDESYVLYLCYAEHPSRGITALRGASSASCCPSSSYGMASNCGCGSHSQTKSAPKNRNCTTQPKPPAQCEPTLTCEGYTFRLRKAKLPSDRRSLGALVDHVSECLKGLVPVAQDSGQLGANEIKAALLEYLDRHLVHNCKLEEIIRQLTLPENTQQRQSAVKALLKELLRECICSGLLPPCPEPALENCVPLATVTVNCNNGCRVVNVCNWSQRRIVVSFSTLEYWFEALLRQSGLAELLNKFCCGPPEREGIPDILLDNQHVKQEIYKKLGAILKDLLSKLANT